MENDQNNLNNTSGKENQNIQNIHINKKDIVINKIIFKAISLLIFLFIFFIAWFLISKSIGHIEAGLNFLNKCPEAVNILGEPIKKSLFYSYGSATRDAESFGNASWTMKVNGSKNSGIYKFNMIKFGPQWYLLNGSLKINNEVIDIERCINKEESKNYQTELNSKQQIIEDIKKLGLPEEEINKLIEKINQSQN
jgi:hypothetical protein